jgi:AraC-like DNA-binding protein
MQSIYIVIISLLAVLIFLLSLKSRKISADKYLVGFFLTIIFGVANDILMEALPDHASIFRFGGIAVPSGAGFIFLYIHALISKQNLSNFQIALLFSPTLVVFIFLIFNSEIEIISSNTPLLIGGYYLFKMGIPLALLIISSYRLTQYKKGLKNTFSYIEDIDFRWLKILIDSSIFLFFLAFAGFLLYRLNVFATIDILMYFTNISLFAFILFLAYYGIKNTWTFRDIIAESTPQQENENTGTKENSEEEILADQQMIDRLESVIKLQKPYLSEKLTIAMLAEMAEIPQKQLSRILNNHYRKNFFDYINALRIEELNERLKKGDSENFTILSIAFECGFSSKSAFNRAYKKQVGVPPSEYVKSGTPV